mgnify:CR=1 FL=1
MVFPLTAKDQACLADMLSGHALHHLFPHQIPPEVGGVDETASIFGLLPSGFVLFPVGLLRFLLRRQVLAKVATNGVVPDDDFLGILSAGLVGKAGFAAAIATIDLGPGHGRQTQGENQDTEAWLHSVLRLFTKSLTIRPQKRRPKAPFNRADLCGSSPDA